METRNLILQLKSASETGTFSGALSVYGNLDRVGDVVQPGAFKKTLEESGGRIPLLINHDSSKQAGYLDLQDSPSALLVKRGVLNLNVSIGQEAYATLKFNAANGLRTGLSIGYRVIKDAVKNGVRYLTELDLFEGSLTPLPANAAATVDSVKNFRNSELDQMVGDFERKLRAITGRPRLSPESELKELDSKVDSFARRLDAIIRG